MKSCITFKSLGRRGDVNLLVVFTLFTFGLGYGYWSAGIPTLLGDEFNPPGAASSRMTFRNSSGGIAYRVETEGQSGNQLNWSDSVGVIMSITPGGNVLFLRGLNFSDLSLISCHNISGAASNLCTLVDSDSNETTRVDNLVGTACPASNYVYNFSVNGTPQCSAPAGAGDITAVNTAGDYLTGGAASGDVSLLLNETVLNTTIDARDTNTNANTVCSGGTTYMDGDGNCDNLATTYLALSGGTMAGGINMNWASITNTEELNVNTLYGATAELNIDDQVDMLNHDIYDAKNVNASAFYDDGVSISDLYINEAGDSTGALTSDLNIDSNTFVISYDDNKVGIGTSSPDKSLHVYAGDSGSSGGIGTDLLIEDDGSVRLEFLTTNTSTARIEFSDTQDVAGFFTYAHSNDALDYYTEDLDLIRVDSSGNLGIGGVPAAKLDVTGDIKCSAKVNASAFYDDGVLLQDTNANTVCSGTTTYMDGDGGCDNLDSRYLKLAGGTMSGNIVTDDYLSSSGGNNYLILDISDNVNLYAHDVSDSDIRIRSYGEISFRTDDDGGNYDCWISDTDGSWNCDGTKNARIKIGDVDYYTHAIEAETVDFVIRGSGETSGGLSNVLLDLTYLQLINASSGYQVYVQETGKCSMYVSEKNNESFKVEVWAGEKDCEFDYLVFALRRGYEEVGFLRSG